MTTPATNPTGPTTGEVAAVSAVLLAYASEQATTNALSRLWGWMRDPRSARAALRLTDHASTAHRGTKHRPRLRGQGPAAREAQRYELTYRAAYIYNAARRIDANLAAGMPLLDALRRERPYYRAHEAARKTRQVVAKRVDREAAIHGALLGWHAHEDDRTTPECRAADRTNFRAGQRPRIGYPGSVHRFCRCAPGAPFATMISVDEATYGISH